MNVLKQRSFKYSSASAVFTAAVIVLVLLANAVLTLLATMFPLFFDLTSAELWTLSDSAKAVFKDVTDEVTITFCHDKDYVESNNYLHYISNTANELDKEFPNINVRYVNSKLNPHLLKDYKNTAGTPIRETDVIVEKGNPDNREIGEKPSEFRKYALDAFFIRDDEVGIWAYNGEEVFAAACLAVTADAAPKAYFTEGHGEALSDSDIAAFTSVMQLAGYEVGRIDLTKSDIPDDCRLLIINDPKYDFAGKSIYDVTAKSEIEVIDRFLEGNRTLMVFKNPETEYLPNLEQFLEEWGIVFGDGIVVDASSSLDIDGKAIVATYPDADKTIAASLQKELSKADAPPKTIVKNVRPITVANSYTEGITEDGKSTHTYELSSNNAYREMSTVLLSSKNAVLEKNGEVSDSSGEYNLLTITRELNQDNTGVYYAYVMAAGTSHFTSEDYLNSNTYGNRDLMYYAFRMMGREKVPADIDFKVFAKTDIENMTAAQAIRTTVLQVTLLPIVATVCGIVIITRRKYR